MTAPANTASELLTENQTADFLNLSVRTLQAWRLRKTGPAFVRAGRSVRYRRSDLAEWIDIQTVPTSGHLLSGLSR